MKKTIGAICLFYSIAVFAINEGSTVDWKDFDNIANSNCTGVIIGQEYVLTAAHCDSSGSVSTSNFDLTHSYVIKERFFISGEEWSGKFDEDISIWKVRPSYKTNTLFQTTKINYFPDLSLNPINYAEYVRVFGFGGTGNQLSYATYEVSDENHIANPDEDYLIEGKFLNQGNIIHGDSGGPWINANNEIVGISSLGGGSKHGYGYGSNLHYAKEFILNIINGWHYPTVVKTNNGLATIKIQSLHALGNETDPQNTMTVSGDVSVLGGSCQTAGVLNAFATCTYEIESQGGEGTLTLSDTEVITINPQETQPEDNNTGSSSGSSGGGGSLGYLSFFFLLLMVRRNK